MSQMVLIAGPYRSGTGDDPALLAANERAMHEAALEVFRRGHLPVTGEALALPLIRVAAAGEAPAPAVSPGAAASEMPAPAASPGAAAGEAPAPAASPGAAASEAPAPEDSPAIAAHVADAAAPGSPLFDEIFHPLARRLVARCDAVLRIGGPSAGADEMVAIAREHGAAVARSINELPDAQVRR